MTMADDQRRHEEGVAEAVRALQKSYETNNRELHNIGTVMDRRFGRQRLWLISLAAVVALALAMGLGFRRADRDRQEAEQRRVAEQRVSLVQGCERGNDLRRTLRQVIEEAYEPSPAPPNLSPELAELLRQSRARAAEKRDDLLALPGVQPVDCLAAYPATDSG